MIRSGPTELNADPILRMTRSKRSFLGAGPFAAGPLAALILSGCTGHLFSPIDFPDRSRPVVRIETRAGVEYGATTKEGILFLGRTAQTGPCRVHYFLGPTPVVEDGEIEHLGGVYFRANIDLKHQNVNLLNRPLSPDDQLIAVVWAHTDVTYVPVTLAQGDSIQGDLLKDPGQRFPVGTPLFIYHPVEDKYYFVGLIAAEAVLTNENGSSEKFVAFTGIDRLREMYLTQSPYTVPRKVKHRPDDISVHK